MPKELFEKIIDQSKNIAEEAVFHILGEPLLHPLLEQYLCYASAAGMDVMITTNGTLLKKQADILLTRDIRHINISLHALNPLENRNELLAEILDFTKQTLDKKPERYMNLRLWNTMTGDNRWIIDRINDLFGTDIPVPQSLGEFKDFKSRPISGRVYLHFDTVFEWPDINSPVKQEKRFCYGIKSHFGILVNGTVVPCCLDGDGVINLGNVKETPLVDILNSVRSQKIFNGFGKKELVEELCRKCSYIGRFEKKR
jgi:radical SAM protein with 4Fe4S-binding SPASM domain